MQNFEELIEKYADLVVKKGVNVQKGQTLVINASIKTADFVRKVAEKAYDIGTKNVHIEWHDDDITRLKYLKAPDDAFKEYPTWRAKGYEEMAENGAAFVSIISDDPDLLKGVDPERISNAQKVAGAAMNTYRQYTQSDKVSWCVIAAPSKEWAAKVFPEGTTEEQVDKLWKAIFKSVRVDTPDPVEAWEKHNANLKEKESYLNNKQYNKLHYKAPGTDLTIELPKNHVWIGGGGPNQDGVDFIANMPTEEVFTLPLKTGVNGVVSSTKPLSYGGNLIENFSFTFENGKIVDIKAESGLDTLKRLVDTDDGSHYLGEVALVPDDSPISNSGIIFLNTLFDENASCHLAIGSAYTTNIEGGIKMSKEELDEHGVNQSNTHVDFMIGSSEMDIDAITEDGTAEPLFRKGNWAF